MRLIYPAIFHRENNSFWVEFPDIEGCHTFGDTIDETLLNAREALELHCVSLLEDGKRLNSPSDVFEMKCEENSFISLIECETKKQIVRKNHPRNKFKRSETI